MGRSSSSTASTNQTQQQDNRVAIGNDGAQVGAFGTYSRDSGNVANSGNTSSFQVSDSSQRNTWTDYSDRSSTSSAFTDASQRNLSTSVVDSSSRDYSDRSSRSSWADNSDRSSSVTTITGVDGGAVEISRMNAALLGSLAETQGDVVGTLAGFGRDALAGANDLARSSYGNNLASWTHTVDKSSELIDHLLLTAQNTVTGAQGVAGAAIAAYMPTANKEAESSSKMVAWIAGGAVLLVLLTHKG